MIFLNSIKQQLVLPNAKIEYYPDCFDKKHADAYFNTLLSETNWRQDNITVFGKSYKQPRLTALYGDSAQSYSYSNITMFPEPYSPTLREIKTKVELLTKEQFNVVLLNLYRDGSDSNGWHADNEKELGKNPVIASVSFGEERPFHFKHRFEKEHRYKLNLNHGSLLIMRGEMQHYWLHQIAKTKKEVTNRINLTFRELKPL